MGVAVAVSAEVVVFAVAVLMGVVWRGLVGTVPVLLLLLSQAENISAEPINNVNKVKTIKVLEGLSFLANEVPLGYKRLTDFSTEFTRLEPLVVHNFDVNANPF